jgi:hypothetical protein
MGTYEVDIDGTKVKVSVVDNTYVASGKIDEFKKDLQSHQKKKHKNGCNRTAQHSLFLI